MPHVREICRAGKVVEVEEYYTRRYLKKGLQREPNRKPTTEQQMKINEKNAVRDLTRILNTNFSETDYLLTYTYNAEEPPTVDFAKKEWQKLIRNTRNLCKRNGEAFKYVHVTEWKNKRIHHHIVMSIGNVDIREVKKLWKHGRVKIQVLDNSGQYKKIAEYLIKKTRKTFRDPESPCKKRWTPSRNLKKPVISKTIVKDDSWRKTPRIWKNYTLEDLYTGYSDYTGYPFRKYTMIRKE